MYVYVEGGGMFHLDGARKGCPPVMMSGWQCGPWESRGYILRCFYPKTVIRTFRNLFESQLFYQMSFLIHNRTF